LKMRLEKRIWCRF